MLYFKWLDTGFGLVIRYIGLLKLVNTSNYSATTNSHTLRLTVACSGSYQSAVSSLVVIW
jgi:hypothetical protein